MKETLHKRFIGMISAHRLWVLLLCISVVTVGRAQHMAVKTNLFYDVYAFSPNLSLELGLASRSTFDLGFSYNPWNLHGKLDDHRKLLHWIAQAEYRYWLCRRFDGHFFGVHVLGTRFNISAYELPLLFGVGSKAYRHDGWGLGGGISYGYSFYLAPRWSIEAQVGVGYMRLHYDRYDCGECGRMIDTKERDYIGPTKAGVSLIYFIN